MLLNLVINARDAMQSKGTIWISARNVTLAGEDVKSGVAQSEFVALSVRDNGAGIPPEVLHRIFEAFFTTKPAGQGTGLGLATCSAIAERSGGWITCESEVGKGTEFTIFLPITAGVAVRLVSDTPKSTPKGGGEKVLVVEDEPAVGELLELLLTNLGYAVLRAEDGQEAQELLAAGDRAVDLVLTDLNMPRIDGRELVRQLAAANPKLRVIFTSGAEIDHLELEEGIVFNFLPKPFTMQNLGRMVRTVLDGETVYQRQPRR